MDLFVELAKEIVRQYSKKIINCSIHQFRVDYMREMKTELIELKAVFKVVNTTANTDFIDNLIPN